MQTQTQTQTPAPAPAPALVYSAELVEEGGVYTLVVTDRIHGTVQTSVVPQRAMDKLPYFLSLLNSRQSAAFR
ncbi:hypothetical protein OG210_28125 [Streptomyces sp. NBC_00466]|uniref:hypothetical protein n=1 Tax=Streptomyces sp. NBC_00466 TaxID=2903655 RepID=UPI0030DF954F